MTVKHCRNCEAPIAAGDRYCAACGQAVVDSSDRSLAQLLRKSAVEVLSVDSRLWRSLRCLLFRPGVLSLEYQAGRRRRYLSPIGLFLLANLLFFLAPPLTDFQLTLSDQYELQPYSGWTSRWIDAHLETSGMSFEALSEAYQLRVIELAKLMVIVHVPLLAAGLMLIAFDKRLFYADHVVVALHYFAFLMLYLLLVSAVLGVVALFVSAGPALGSRLGVAAFLLHLVYVPVMFRTALQMSWLRAILSTPIFLVALLVAHFAYRLIQFIVAFTLITA